MEEFGYCTLRGISRSELRPMVLRPELSHSEKWLFKQLVLASS